MSELDGLEEIEIGPNRSTGSAKRMRNGRKQLRKIAGHTIKWKTNLRRYQTKKANKQK